MTDRTNSLEIMRTLLKEQRFSQAVVASNHYQQNWGTDIESLWIQATAYFELGDLSAAEDTLKLYLSMDANNVQALKRLAEVLRGKNRAEEAIQILAGHTQTSARADLSAELAQSYMEAGNSDLAILHAKQALEIDSNSVQALMVLGSLLIFLGTHNEALKYIRQAQPLAPANPQVYINLAAIYEAQGNIDAQIDAYQDALLCDSRLSEVRLLLGKKLIQRGNYQEATEQFLTNIAQGDDRADTHFHLALAHKHSGQFQKAIEALLKLIKNQEVNILYLLELAECYAQLSQTDHARSVIEHILSIDAGNKRALDMADVIRD